MQHKTAKVSCDFENILKSNVEIGFSPTEDIQFGALNNSL